MATLPFHPHPELTSRAHSAHRTERRAKIVCTVGPASST
jgi:hypothetical protein